MENLIENLRIANEIKNMVKQRVISSNDIIPRTILPAVYDFAIPMYAKAFGLGLIGNYLEHCQRTRAIRGAVLDEVKKQKYLAPQSTSALAITKYGVGEAQEIATLCFSELIDRGYNAIQFIGLEGYFNDSNQLPYIHCLVLIGIEHQQLLIPSNISVLDDLPAHVVALDPYLDYVGPANQYNQSQEIYLKLFAYEKIFLSDHPTDTHRMNAIEIKKNIAQMEGLLECQRFYRNFLTLSLSCFSPSELLPCHETALISFLNQSSGLIFAWGHRELKVSAYVDVSVSSDYEKALSIQDTLQAGTFYQQDAQRFFVLHDINEQPNLAERIQENYRR
jgi:hypothetical protein